MTYVKAAYEVILIAEERSSINLEHDVEAYVVHTFARYIEKPNIPTDAIAIKMLTTVNEHGESRKKKFQEIAEECLLIDGLGLNRRKWPSQNYYSDMGKLALEYRAWSARPPELFYGHLAKQFYKISTVLHSVKQP